MTYTKSSELHWEGLELSCDIGRKVAVEALWVPGPRSWFMNSILSNLEGLFTSPLPHPTAFCCLV